MIVHVLNVGQGSCTVLLAPSGAVTVVDGGDERAWPGRVDAVEWLQRTGITRIDTLVLTHLHRDHAQGLLALARAFPVGVAHLPYARFAPPRPSAAWRSGFTRNADVDSPHGQLQLVTDYLDLLDVLDAAGTPIVTAEASFRLPLWHDGDWTLEQLHPHDDERATARLVEQLGRADDDAITGLLDELSEHTNEESAVFLLRAAERSAPPVVITGDQCGSDDRWERIAARADLTGCVWVLPHHGAPDGPSPAFVASLSPVLLVASAADRGAAGLADYWAALETATGSAVVATHRFPDPDRARFEFDGLRVVVGA